MKIAFGYGRGVVLNIKELTFSELAELCKTPKKDQKFSDYFIRGGEMLITEGDPTAKFEPQRHKHYHRNNKSLLKGEILIIDGDSSIDDDESAPEPNIIHKELKKLKINHFIYTTHSHKTTKNKDKIRWRAIIPCVVDFGHLKKNSDSVKLTTNKIVDLLSESTGLKKSNEQNTWSQAWYMPTRDNPNDEMFEFYSYFKGKDYEALDPETVISYDETVPVDKQTNLDYETIEEVYADFLSGKHCYTSIRKITFMNIKDGQTKPATIANAQALMQASPLKVTDPDRWKVTYDQIENLVNDAWKKINEVAEKVDDSFESEYEEINDKILEDVILPKNCMLTELTLALYKTWWTPNILAARLAAFSTIAYLAGGKYRSSLGDRVNLQQVIIGPTGTGKDIIMKAPPSVIIEVWAENMAERDKILSGIIEEVGSAEGVDYKLRSSGVKHDVLLTIDEIGGLMRQAKKDIFKQRFFDYSLKMYTKADGILSERAVTKKKDKELAETLYAPHMIITGATTPKLMLSGIDSSFITYGNASRMMFYNCGPYVEDNLKKLEELNLSDIMKFNIKALYDQKVIEKIHPLPTARVHSPKNVDMTEIEEYCWEISAKDRKRMGEFKDIWNRRVANAKKYAMIRAILNDPENPKVTLEMIKNEIEFVGASCEYSERMFKNMVGENDLDMAKKSVISRLLKAIEKGKKLVPQKILNDTYSMRKIQPHQRKTILNELVEDGIIRRLEKIGKSGRGKKIVLYEFTDSDDYEVEDE